MRRRPKPRTNYRQQQRDQERQARRESNALKASQRRPKPDPEDRRPRVLVCADVKTWAWARKAEQLVKYLSDDYYVDIWYSKLEPRLPEGFDLYHTFEVSQMDSIPRHVPPAKVVTGLTAHVWRTWGEDQVRTWADRACALHANSVLLVEELAHLVPQRVYYTPNGVCPRTFQRTIPRSGPLVVGHVGKPNPRKGAALIREACQQLDIELRTVQRKSGNALSVDEMVQWYQGIDVMAFASDMDGTPNPALEGAACECAVVSTPIGNMPEFVVDGVNGYLVDRTVEGLVGALRPLRDSPTLTRAMGREARKTVLSAWTWARQSGYYRRMWRDVLAGTVGRKMGEDAGKKEAPSGVPEEAQGGAP